MKIIILAGGTGTRLWPLSRKTTPKQLSAIISEKTMIEETVERFKDAFDDDDIYFSTTEALEKQIKELFPKYPDDHFIVEPEKRDSGPAMGYVAAYLSRVSPDEPIAFIPCDHYIHNTELFIQNIKRAGQIIKDTGKMLDIAITPNFPSTVLGYTRIGKRYESKDGIDIFYFRGHVEKPDLQTAQKLLESKEYLWHANYYMWTPKLFLEAYKKYAPEMYKHLEEIIKGLDQEDEEQIKNAYAQMEKISIDYAITEKMNPKDVLIIEGTFGWSDIGAWDVLHDQLKEQHDEHHNILRGNIEVYDTTNSLIYNMAQEKKLVTAIGVENMVIINTPDALLVCPQKRSQDVKNLVKQLKEKGKEEYL